MRFAARAGAQGYDGQQRENSNGCSVIFHLYHENESPGVLVSEGRTGCLVTTPFGKDLLIVGNGAEILEQPLRAAPARKLAAPQRPASAPRPRHKCAHISREGSRASTCRCIFRERRCKSPRGASSPRFHSGSSFRTRTSLRRSGARRASRDRGGDGAHAARSFRAGASRARRRRPRQRRDRGIVARKARRIRARLRYRGVLRKPRSRSSLAERRLGRRRYRDERELRVAALLRQTVTARRRARESATAPSAVRLRAPCAGGSRRSSGSTKTCGGSAASRPATALEASSSVNQLSRSASHAPSSWLVTIGRIAASFGHHRRTV